MFEVEATGWVASEWGDPGPDETRPALSAVPAARRRSRSRLVVTAVLAVAFVAANGFTLQHLSSTRDDAAGLAAERGRTEAELAQRRSDLTTLRTRIDAALADLGQQTETRDDLNTLNQARRDQAAKTASDLRAALTQISLGRAHESELDQCLLRLQAALNTASVGDESFGPAALADVQRVCGASR